MGEHSDLAETGKVSAPLLSVYHRSGHDDIVAAERDVLGAMLLNPECIGDVVSLLRPEDFGSPRHAAIFRAIVAEHRAGGVADPLTVGQRLQRSGKLDEAGGHDYLLDLLDSVVTGASVQRHAQIVHEAASRRRFAEAAAGLARAARDGAPLEELVAMLEQARPRPAAPPVRLGRSWIDVADDPPVEWIADGLLPTAGLVVLAGDPNAGKSALAIDLALRAAHGLQWLGRDVTPCSTVYLSYEGALGARMRAWRQAHPAALTVDGNYLHVDEDRRPNLTDPDALAQLERVLDGAAAANGGRPPSLLVIDTLARAIAGGDENDSGALGAALEAVAELQRRRSVTVLLLHHTRKPQAGSNPKADGMHALRGSSALAGAADVVLLAVCGEDDVRTLRTAKVRDGEILPPMHYRILGQDTGRERRNGRRETAPVVLPAMAATPTAQVSADQQLAENIEAVVAAVAARGPELRSRDAVSAAATLRAKDGRTAIDAAVARGRIIVGKGRDNRPTFAVPAVPPPAVPPSHYSGRPRDGADGEKTAETAVPPSPPFRGDGDRDGAPGRTPEPIDPAKLEKRVRFLQQRAADQLVDLPQQIGDPGKRRLLSSLVGAAKARDWPRLATSLAGSGFDAAAIARESGVDAAEILAGIAVATQRRTTA